MNTQDRLIAALKRALEATTTHHATGRPCICWQCEASDLLAELENCPACHESPCVRPCEACGGPCTGEHDKDCPLETYVHFTERL